MADSTSQNGLPAEAHSWCGEWTKEDEQPEKKPQNSLAEGSYRWCGEWTPEDATQVLERFDDFIPDSIITAIHSTNSLTIPLPSLTIQVTYSDARSTPPANTSAKEPLDPEKREEEQTPDTSEIEIPTTPAAYCPVLTGSSIILGRLNGTHEPVLLNYSERSSGVYVIGATGAGKTSGVLVPIALQDIEKGHGLFFLDPNGDAIEDILSRIPEKRLSDVVLLDPGNMTYPFGINLLSRTEKAIDFDATKLMGILKRLWGVDSDQPFWGPRLENALRNCIYTLLYNGLTLAELPLLLRSDTFRAALVKNIPSDGRWIRYFWEQEFNTLSHYLQVEKTESTLNKIYQLLTVREVEYVVSQRQTTIDMRNLMDTQKIILLRLTRHTIGEDAQKFLGTILLSELFEAALGRANVKEEERPFFSVVIDEFQNFLSPLFYHILPEIRKYNLGIVVAHQFLAQIDEETRGATQQLATHITFRVRPKDAESLAAFYAKQPTPELRRQEILTPASNPLDRIMIGHTHTDERVNRFVSYYLVGSWPFVDENQELFFSRSDGISLIDIVSNKPEQVLNDLVYKVMCDKHAKGIVRSPEFTRFLIDVFHFYFYAPVLFPYHVHEESLRRSDSSWGGYFDRLTRNYVPYRNSTSYTFEPPTLNHVQSVDEELLALIEILFSSPSQQEKFQAAEQLETLMIERYHGHIKAFKNLQAENDSKYASYYVKEGDFYTELKKKHVQAYVKAARFLLPDLKEVLDILSVEPIAVGSGIYEMVEIGRRPIADMIAEMAQELVHLPNQSAYIKRGAGTIPPSLIQTVPLPAGCDEQRLQQRKEQVIQQTTMYGVERCRLEEELQQRHLKYTKGVLPHGTIVESTPESKVVTANIPQPGTASTPTSALTVHPLVFTGSNTTPATYLELLYYLSNATLKQLVRLTGREDESKKEQEKVKQLVDAGLLEATSAAFLSTGGRAPLVYSLKKRAFERLRDEKGLQPIRQGDFNRHSYMVNEVIITAVCGSKELPITLAGFEHEKQFRQRPIALERNQGLEPDCLLQFLVNGELQSIFLEIDLLTEATTILIDKVQKYLKAIKNTAHPGFETAKKTVAFIIPDGSPENTNRLLRIIEQAVQNTKDGEYFLVASLPRSEITPSYFLTGSFFLQPFDTRNTYALIELASLE